MNVIFSPSEQPLNLAVVGTGIAGMATAWLLNKRHNVTVFEENNYVGGHSNTVESHLQSGITPVDTGFIVYNQQNYPNLTALFDHLGVKTLDSDMSFAASIDDGQFEYSGADFNGLVGQRLNLVRPRFWRMVKDLVRFYRTAPSSLTDPYCVNMSLGEYLDRGNYNTDFLNDHLLPLGAAIWSTTAEDMKAYPLRSFVRFFVSHGLFRLSDRPQWRTVEGGSRAYVRKLTDPFKANIVHQGIRSINRCPEHVVLEDTNGNTRTFDHVVIATHADQAFRMLGDPSPQETSLLGKWQYTNNRAVLHLDPALMPKRKTVWSSWNFIKNRRTDANARLCVTYWMNRLQSLASPEQIFVTLNPITEPKDGLILREFNYTHPYFDQAALDTQKDLWSLQGVNRTWFCGSYFGYGFHEDALQSGLAVGEQLGGLERPWTVADQNGRIHLSSIPQRVAI